MAAFERAKDRNGLSAALIDDHLAGLLAALKRRG